jgi:hypothetical protein
MSFDTSKMTIRLKPSLRTIAVGYCARGVKDGFLIPKHMCCPGIDADADSGSELHVSERQFHCAARSYKEGNDEVPRTGLARRSVEIVPKNQF